jgi:Mce-associated membrane protein
VAIDAVTPEGELDPAAPERPAPGRSARPAIAVGLAIVAAMAGLLGWLSYSAYTSHQAQRQHNLFLQVARQGALNLTTIDYTRADSDVTRILDSSVGKFRDDFQRRSRPFIDLVTQTQSKSEGSITEAAVESEQGDHAQVLVAVNVNTSVAGTPEPQPRAWRMRISVQRIGNDAKVCNVEFVS